MYAKDVDELLQKCVEERKLQKEVKDKIMYAAMMAVQFTESTPLEQLSASRPEGLEAIKAANMLKTKISSLVNSDEFKQAHPDSVRAQELADKVC